VAEVPRGRRVLAGETVGMRILPDACMIFDPSGPRL
jgi:hypothetical protein